MITLSSKDNKIVKHISKLLRSAKYRRESGEFVAEGARLCEDAMLSGAQISAVFVTENALERYHDTAEKLISYAQTAYIVTPAVFAAVSDTKSPQGILCSVKPLDKTTLFDKIKSNGKFLALENIQDPSNLGTILRTAEALGVDGVVLTDDCCDIHSPKVVRGSMGAVFRLPYMSVGSMSGFLSENDSLKSFAAVVSNADELITDLSFPKGSIVVVGNEGNGLREETIAACRRKITIPMKGRAESLNAAVAASIIMWEMMK